MTGKSDRGVCNVYPCYRATGTPRELGRQHGARASGQIRGFLDYLGSTMKLSRAQLHLRALRFLPLFERYAPHLVEEINGLAEGAGIPLAEALAVQIRGELAQVQEEGCTTFVITARGTASGQVLIGQNSDVEPELEEFAYVLHLEPHEKPAILLWTFEACATTVKDTPTSQGNTHAWPPTPQPATDDLPECAEHGVWVPIPTDPPPGRRVRRKVLRFRSSAR